jgi:hypothetical protein
MPPLFAPSTKPLMAKAIRRPSGDHADTDVEARVCQSTMSSSVGVDHKDVRLELLGGAAAKPLSPGVGERSPVG